MDLTRTKVLAGAAIAACGLTALVLVATAATQAAPSPFTIDPLPAELRPGQVLTVSGSGCPAASDLDTGPEPLLLQLHSPGGELPWAPTLDGSTVVIGPRPAIGVVGTVETATAPAADGTFSVAITIPLDAPPMAGYSVDGLCTTLLEPGDTPSGFSQASLDAANATAAGLTVVEADDTSAQTPAAAPAPVQAPAGFTG
jgi:hypothetical protein